jgi:hypothetical protein
VPLFISGTNFQDKLLHFENLLAWEENFVKNCARTKAESIVSRLLENIFHVRSAWYNPYLIPFVLVDEAFVLPFAGGAGR